jgi:multiple sugar transport system substrate-binding protein
MLTRTREILQGQIIVWLFACLLLSVLGCEPQAEEESQGPITYTLDPDTQMLVAELAQQTKLPIYSKFNRHFSGLFVPPTLLPWEPYVLALSTESKIPAIISLDAPWVQRYGMDGWLYELERTKVFPKNEVGDLTASVVAAFSVPLPRIMGPPVKELVAVPTYIKGNILFYRQDLLQRYQFKAPPRTWDELKAMCRKIMPQERSLKYGLIFHPSNFLNDFLPMLWGYGGEVVDANDRLVLHQDKNRAACLAALSDLKGMQGAIAPAPKDLAQFTSTQTDALRQAFFRGEALFMINWDTRLNDLKEMIGQDASKTPRALTDLAQVGVTPIPCQSGQLRRYSTIGSPGWAINRFAVSSTKLIHAAQKFISVVADKQFQVLAAEKLGRVPARQSALNEVTNKEVLKVYRNVFALADMELKTRPFNRLINNTLEKYFSEVIYGRRSPEDAVQTAIVELKNLGTDK